VPYLTPQELPEDDDCRPLSIPADSEWLALFGGALTELTKSWNWEDSGGLTVDETVNKMMEIVNNWYTLPCAACTTPGGYRVIRIGNSGHVEQLDENGDWVEATDEYLIPPPEAREGGTEQDQICLAAANAVNVYEQLYESLSESWSGEVDEAEAVAALIGVMVGVIGFAFAPIVYGIYAFMLPIFGVLFAALEYLTADLWDEEFSQTLECFLVNCATNTDGVVTFDWQCFIDQLNSQTNPFDLTETQIRLYLQVIYLLYFTGGVDGLNLAGGTTEIDEADCTDCVGCASYADTLDEGLGEKTHIVHVHDDNLGLWDYPTADPTGAWSGSTLDGLTGYVQSEYVAANNDQRLGMIVDLGMECLVVGWELLANSSETGVCDGSFVWAYYDNSQGFITSGGGCFGSSGVWDTRSLTGIPTVARYVYFFMQGNSPGGVLAIKDISITVDP